MRHQQNRFFISFHSSSLFGQTKPSDEAASSMIPSVHRFQEKALPAGKYRNIEMIYASLLPHFDASF
jgi:hypothetical protein